MDPAAVPRVTIGAGESSVTSFSAIGLGTWRVCTGGISPGHSLSVGGFVKLLLEFTFI